MLTDTDRHVWLSGWSVVNCDRGSSLTSEVTDNTWLEQSDAIGSEIFY